MKSLSPGQTLVFLLLLGLAIAGWLYGVHWKRTMSGDIFTEDETRIIELQDRVRVLTENNAKLNSKIVELTSDEEQPELPELPPPPGSEPKEE